MRHDKQLAGATHHDARGVAYPSLSATNACENSARVAPPQARHLRNSYFATFKSVSLSYGRLIHLFRAATNSGRPLRTERWPLDSWCMTGQMEGSGSGYAPAYLCRDTWEPTNNSAALAAADELNSLGVRWQRTAPRFFSGQVTRYGGNPRCQRWKQQRCPPKARCTYRSELPSGFKRHLTFGTR